MYTTARGGCASTRPRKNRDAPCTSILGVVNRVPLALGAQPVGDQCEVGVVVAAFLRGALDRLELVLHDRLGVEQQPADQKRAGGWIAPMAAGAVLVILGMVLAKVIGL